MNIVDEWLKEAEGDTTESVSPEPAQLTHPDRLVSWIDILGMRQRIKKNSVEDSIEVMEALHSNVRANCDVLAMQGKLHYLQVGDGFTIVADLDCHDILCSILCNIQWEILVYSGMTVRGAIAAGPIGINENPSVIIGPAFIEAYQLESENAIFPRIILSDSINKHVPEMHRNFKYIESDSDQIQYLDFISFIVQDRGLNSKMIEEIFETEHVYAEMARQHKDALNNGNPNTGLLQKYGWLIDKFRAHKVDLLSKPIGSDLQ